MTNAQMQPLLKQIDRQKTRAVALIDLKNQPDYSVKMHRAKPDMQGRRLCRLIPDGCVFCESYKD